MNHNHFGEHRLSPEKIIKTQLKMLVIIVNRSDGEKVTKLLRKNNFHFQFTCLAEGTSGLDILDLLGFGSVDKAVTMSVSRDLRISSLLLELSKALKLNKAGKGIAFTIPLTGIALPESFEANIKEYGKKWNNYMETEVDKMYQSLTHDVILAVVNKGTSEELVTVARTAGATGGTVINARNTGMEDMIGLLGVSIQIEKEIVAIITKRETKQNIMDALNDSFGAKTQAHGIILSLPVDSVVGLDNQKI